MDPRTDDGRECSPSSGPLERAAGRKREGEPVPGDVSSLLRAWSDGDELAPALLMPIVHDELRRLAHHCMRRERAGHSLQTTALVNEAYLRLVQAHALAKPRPFRGGSGAGNAPHPRRPRASPQLQAGSGAEHVSLDADAVMCPDRSDDFVSLDEALTGPAERTPRKAKVVELRFFGGLSVEETAEVLRVSPITVMRK